MKPSEIQVGKVYTNGKGRYRKILEEGNGPISGCIDYDKIRYTCNRGDWWMTRRRFADWAKSEVTDEP